MGNRLLVVIMVCLLGGLFCCKSRPADIITPYGPTDSPTHQSTTEFIMYDSSWRNDSTATEIDYGINYVTSVLMDTAKGYVIYHADTFHLKTGETNLYASSTHWPYAIAEVTMYPDTIRFFGTMPAGWGNSQTDHVAGFRVK